MKTCFDHVICTWWSLEDVSSFKLVIFFCITCSSLINLRSKKVLTSLPFSSLSILNSSRDEILRKKIGANFHRLMTNADLSVLLPRLNIDPRTILATCHKNCMYTKAESKEEKSFQEASTQSMHIFNDEETQVSQMNESKDTQTSSVTSRVRCSPSKKYTFTNPYAILERVHQGEQFLKFLQKQNLKLDLIYTNFLQHLQKYADQFLLSLQQEHGLYSVYRRDLIWSVASFFR